MTQFNCLTYPLESSHFTCTHQMLCILLSIVLGIYSLEVMKSHLPNICYCKTLRVRAIDILFL